MTNGQRHRMERTLSQVIGLELWLIGELELSERELLDLFSSIQTRMSVIQAIAWPSEADSAEEASAFDGEAPG